METATTAAYPFRLGLLCDSPERVGWLESALEQQNRTAFTVERIPWSDSGPERLAGFDLLVLDLCGRNGAGALRLQHAAQAAPHLPRVSLVGPEDDGAQTLRLGARDFIVCDADQPVVLAQTLRHALERQQAEDALWACEGRFRAIRERLPVGILAFGANGDCQYVNAWFEGFTGQTGAAALGDGWTQIAVPDERDRLLAGWRDAAEGRRTFSCCLAVRRAAHRLAWCDLRIAPVARDDPEAGSVGVLTDVTEARSAVNDLSEVLSGARCVLWTADVRLENETFVWDLRLANRAAAESLLGLRVAPGQTDGAAWVECLGEAQLAEMNRRSQTALTSGSPGYEQEIRFQPPGGAARWLREHVCIRQGGGGRWRVIGVCTDITEQRRAQERLLATQKLASLTALAQGLAHRFNSLLTVIMGNAALARLEADEGSNLSECLGEIETAAADAADLSSQMLDYAGRDDISPRPVELSGLVGSLEQLLRSTSGAAASMEFDLAPHLPEAPMDALRIQQALLNLTLNAGEAIGDAPGVIHLRTGRATLTAAEVADSRFEPQSPPGDYVFVEVTDDGCGMDAATRARLFDPFFSTRFAGRGLGMAAVLGIIRAHNGAVEVETEPGRGTRVRLLLPTTDGDKGGAPEYNELTRRSIPMEVEALIRGQLQRLDLTEANFCPECCGTLAWDTDRKGRHLRCQSCGLPFRPAAEAPQAEEGAGAS